MLGYINDCMEKLVVNEYGLDGWHAVKKHAGIEHIPDGGFVKLEPYSDEITQSVIQAASWLANISEAEIVYEVGKFFAHSLMEEGYGNLLCSQGSTLKDWCVNINAVHQHLQTTFPNSIQMPEFWCQKNQNSSLTLYYYSSRGNYLAPLAVGLIEEVASFHFDLDIVMEMLTKQGIDGSKFTSWMVTTRNSQDLWKLCHVSNSPKATRNDTSNAATNNDTPAMMKCPFTGTAMTKKPEDVNTDTVMKDGAEQSNMEQTTRPTSTTMTQHPLRKNGNSSGESIGSVFTHKVSNDGMMTNAMTKATLPPGTLDEKTVGKLFPYHIMIDDEFCIIQVGPQLCQVLETTADILYTYEIDEVFDFLKPRPAKWTRSWLRKLEDAGQEFVLEPKLSSAPEELTFKGTLIFMNNNNGEGEDGPNKLSRDYTVMMILCPDAKNLDELQAMNLTLSDLPAHGSYRDSVFLREHLSRQMNNAAKMEKLSNTLQTEKELLEQLLPHHAAEGLRHGKRIEPMLHNNVTMFFSDIVGFTQICKTIRPWEVINMLNQLYGIMDHLAKKYNLFKVETIGDAYVCCSGLPESDPNHATNVANFAVAIAKHSSMISSPLDGSPLQLRIGVHTGACASGIVGVTNPRYCVFGDTVNTTARHESTGEPGKVHCSLTTMIELMQRAPGQFHLISRGLVEMKGRGEQPTYWLEAADSNPCTGVEGMKQLDEELIQKFADIGDMDDDQSKMSARHVIASPGASMREQLIIKSKSTRKSRRRLISKDELEEAENSSDDDSYSTDASSNGLGSDGDFTDYTGTEVSGNYESTSKFTQSSLSLSRKSRRSLADKSQLPSPARKSPRNSSKALPVSTHLMKRKEVVDSGGGGASSNDVASRLFVRSKASKGQKGRGGSAASSTARDGNSGTFMESSNTPLGRGRRRSSASSSAESQREGHDTDLLKAIDLVEAVMTKKQSRRTE